jgi:hypothetical protein
MYKGQGTVGVAGIVDPRSFEPGCRMSRLLPRLHQRCHVVASTSSLALSPHSNAVPCAIRPPKPFIKVNKYVNIIIKVFY